MTHSHVRFDLNETIRRNDTHTQGIELRQIQKKITSQQKGGFTIEKKLKRTWANQDGSGMAKSKGGIWGKNNSFYYIETSFYCEMVFKIGGVLCVCAYIYISTYRYSYTYRYKHTYLYVYMCIYTCVATYISTYMNIWTYAYVCIYTRIYVSIYIYTCMNIYIFMYIYTYIATQDSIEWLRLVGSCKL